jgi:SM-20-related protein
MLEQILQEMERRGFSYVENLLSADDLKSIHYFFESHRSNFSAAQIGLKDQKQRIQSIRGDHTLWIDPLRPPEAFISLTTFLDTLREKMNEKFYLGLRQYECHLSFYPPGTFYSKHMDCFEKKSSRRLSFVFYLNQEWKEDDGGELVIYDKQGSTLKTCYPRPGAFVTFLSDEFPHEVKTSCKERRSFTGWMHTTIIY